MESASLRVLLRDLKLSFIFHPGHLLHLFSIFFSLQLPEVNLFRVVLLCFQVGAASAVCCTLGEVG